MQEAARILLPNERVANCLRRPVSRRLGIDIYRKNGRIRFAGLQVCGSIWVCPLCSARISEQRKLELEEAIETALQNGYQVILLTLTSPHRAYQPLEPLLEKMLRARTLHRQRQAWKKWVKCVGLVGSIRALEVTHGENGWHVHFHELLLLEPGADPVDIDQAVAALLSGWQDACVDADLRRPSHHGIDIQDGEFAARYLGKWGFGRPKGHFDQVRAGGRTSWDLLRDVYETGDCRSAELFREFSRCFKGRRQLLWSKGLRNLLGVGEEAADRELADRKDKQVDHVGALTHRQWRLLQKHGRVGSPGERAMLDALYRHTDGRTWVFLGFAPKVTVTGGSGAPPGGGGHGDPPQSRKKAA